MQPLPKNLTFEQAVAFTTNLSAKTDWEKLSRQKLTLMRFAESPDLHESERADVDGLINFIDFLEDNLLDF